MKKTAKQGRGKSPGDKRSHWINFATREEKDSIHYEINAFGHGDVPWTALVVKNDMNVFTYKKGGMYGAYLLPRDGKQRFKGLMGNPGLKHFGLFLGLFHPGNPSSGRGRRGGRQGQVSVGGSGAPIEFHVSLEAMSELARCGGLTRNWVKVTLDGEKSVLYGNDIKFNQVDSTCEQGISHDRGICAILNLDGDCLAIGVLEADDPFLSSIEDEDQVVVRVLADRGLYLRRGE